MNKKGFTLIELLVAIGLLLLISIIAVPSILKLQDRGNKKAENAQEKAFIALAKIYGDKNEENILDDKNTNDCYFISLQYMMDIDLLSEIPSSNSDDEKYNAGDGVKICRDSEKRSLEYTFIKEKENNGIASVTEIPKKEVSFDDLIIDSESGGNSSVESSFDYTVIGTGYDYSGAKIPEYDPTRHIPVVYDSSCNDYRGCWRKADTSKRWYNYNKGIWPNIAKVAPDSSYCTPFVKDKWPYNYETDCFDTLQKYTREQYLSAPVNTPISWDDITALYVWVPKFSYNNTDPTDVSFVYNGTAYTIHPIFSGENSNGFLVNKFGSKSNEEIDALKYLTQSRYGLSNSLCSKLQNSVAVGYPCHLAGYSYDEDWGYYYTYHGKKIGEYYDAENVRYAYHTAANRYDNLCNSTTGNVYGVYDIVYENKC